MINKNCNDDVTRVCVICWRPLQLMNIINFVETKLDKEKQKYSIDLFISDLFKSYKWEVKEINKYFANIIYFRDKASISKCEMLSGYIFLRRSIKSDLYERIKFDNYSLIIATGFHYFSIRLSNMNPNAKLILLEDGTSAYVNDELKQFNSSKPYRLLKLINRGVLSIDIKCGYRYHPELIQFNPTYKVEKFNVPDERVQKIIQKAFQFKQEIEYDKFRIVYLTSDETLKNKYNFDEDTFINKISLTYDNILVRLHPNKKNKDETWHVDMSNEMWELICPQLNDSNILIGAFSTAQLTPYLLYGIKCKIIFLYKFVFPKESDIYLRIDSFISSIKPYYNDIYSPNSLRELYDILSDIT